MPSLRLGLLLGVKTLLLEGLGRVSVAFSGISFCGGGDVWCEEGTCGVKRGREA